MTSIVKCPKCGMTQMSSAQCKGCGRPMPGATAAPRPTAPHPAGVGPRPPAPRPVAPRPAVALQPSRGALAVQPLADSIADPAFDRDQFLVKQKVLTIGEKYDITDEHERPFLFAHRPAHALRNGAAALGGVVSGFAVGAAVLWLSGAVLPNDAPGWVISIVAMLALGGGVVTLLTVAAVLQKKRHVTIYRDETQAEPLLEVLQDEKLVFIRHTYTVREPGGATLALLSKNILTDVFRKRWECRAPDGRMICVAKEDSVLKAILRRFVSKLIVLNFVILRGESEELLGEFNRKFTLRDRYALDLSRDRARVLDRRIAVALALMLDTGEKR